MKPASKVSREDPSDLGDISDPVNADLLIKHLSWRPTYVQDSVIEIHLKSAPAFIQAVDVRHDSSAGMLGSLPIELLHLALSHLDFMSLYGLLRTSTRARFIVEALPAYRKIVSHACEALAVLTRTKLISAHSATSLYTALRSESCSACERYGPFLYILLCRRHCFHCLKHDRTFRVINREQASMIYGVSLEYLKTLPYFYSISGGYRESEISHHSQRIELFDEKMARDLGTKVHGSEEAMLRYAETKSREILRPSWLMRTRADNQGTTSVLFPSLTPQGEREDGLWCIGCYTLRRTKGANGVSPTQLLKTVLSVF